MAVTNLCQIISKNVLKYRTVYGFFSQRLTTMRKFDHVGKNSQYAPVNYCHKELHLRYCGSPRLDMYLEQVALAALL